MTPSSVITWMWCVGASALTIWRLPMSKPSVASCEPNAPSPNATPYSFASTFTLVPGW